MTLNGRVSQYLPPSLGTLFGQPVEVEAVKRKAMPPASIEGAFNAPELCLLAETYRPEFLPRHALGEVKLDGIRALHIGGNLVTREGSPFEAAAHCLPVLRSIEEQFGQPMFFDGEYVEEGGLEATLSAFRSRTGRGCLWLFDAVPLVEWQSGKPGSQSLLDRKARLREAYRLARSDEVGVPVGFIEARHLLNVDEVEEAAQALWKEGYEGLVVKDGRAPYVRKRTCDWQKVKLRSQSQMTVVDVIGCTRGGVEAAKSLQVRIAGQPTARPCFLPVHGGVAETLWRNRSSFIGTDVTVEHAGFTGGGQPREAQLKTVTFAAGGEA